MSVGVDTRLLKLFWAICFFLVFFYSVTNLINIYFLELQRPSFVSKLNQKQELHFYAYISGAVERPGVYEIVEGMRIIDLVELAGGLDPMADFDLINSKINLAKLVFNEDHIVIPFKASDETDSDSSGSLASTSKLVNINTASQAELEELPGIGSSTAEKIISSRPFATIEDVKQVDGIGDKKFKELVNYISI